MTRRIRLLRASLGYEGGLVLHTAASGAVPRLDEIRLLAEEDGELAALGATRINIAYLTGYLADRIEAALLDAANAVDWTMPWSELTAELDRRRPDLVSPARMLFEMAAADGAARAANLSLAETLGAAGPPRDTGTNQTLFWSHDATMLARAAGYVARGFTDLKLRVGIGAFSDDVRRLSALRNRHGADIRLAVDINGTWAAEDAPARLDALARFGLDYVEQPLAAGAWAETARLAASSPVPIMLDESLGSLEAVRRLADTRAAPLAHLKLAKLGGLDRAVTAALLLAEAGIGIMVGQMNEGSVSTAAAAHLACALDARYRELYGADGLLEEPAQPPLTYAEGRLRLPAGAGLGLDRYPVPASAITLWDKTV